MHAKIQVRMTSPGRPTYMCYIDPLGAALPPARGPPRHRDARAPADEKRDAAAAVASSSLVDQSMVASTRTAFGNRPDPLRRVRLRDPTHGTLYLPMRLAFNKRRCLHYAHFYRFIVMAVIFF